MSDVPGREHEIRLDYPVPIQQVPHFTAMTAVGVVVPVEGPDGQVTGRQELRPMLVAYMPTGPWHLIIDWEEAEAIRDGLSRMLVERQTGIALPPPKPTGLIVPRNGQTGP